MRQLLSVTQIADDQAPGFAATANWATYSGGVGFQGDYCYSLTGAASDAATWTFAVTPGQYRVAATWVANTTSSSTRSPFTVLDVASPRGTALVNQRQSPNDLVDAGASWEQLGEVYNITGSSLVVRLANANDGYVIADGIRIERIGDLPPTPHVSVLHGNNIIPQATGSIDFGEVLTHRPVTKTFTVVNQGAERLDLEGSISVPAGYTVAAGLNSISLEQGESTTFAVQLDATAANDFDGQITLASNDPDEPQFNFNVSGTVRPVQIVDDGMAGFQPGNSWIAAQIALGLDGDLRYTLARPGSAVDSTTWAFPVTPGTYRVSATWFARPHFASNASYAVFDGVTPLGTAVVNQRQAPDGLLESGMRWEQFGTVYNITGNSLVVELANTADGYVIADGIRVERVGDLPATPEMSVLDGNHNIANDSGSIDFGSVLTDRPVTKTFTVVNHGTQRLELSNSIIVPAGFTVVAPLGLTSLGQGESTTFSVRLDAAVADRYAGRITLSSNDADEAQFNFNVSGHVRPVQILDDGMEGFSPGGNWTSAQIGLANDGDLRYTLAPLGSAVNSSSWTFHVAPGKYRVAATWFASLNYASNATFTVFDGDTPLATVTANQRQAPDDLIEAGVKWENLGGVYTIRGSTLVVRLTNVANGYVLADAIRVEGQNNISNLRLVRDTGISSSDYVTTDAAVTGTVASDGSSAGILVSFDLNGDDAPEAMIPTDNTGRFTYTPLSLPVGPRTIRARSQKWDPDLHSYIFGDWTSLSFILQTAVNLPLTVASLELLNPSGGTPALPTTTDPTLTGTVANDGPVGSLRVEFDFDGNDTVDAFTRTDAAGNFTYRPAGLQPGGLRTVRARAIEWNDTTSTFINSNWKSFTFRFDPLPPPVISLLRLIEDNGESPTDLRTTNPRLAGAVTAQTSVFGLTVEFDHNNDGAVDGTALTDYEGNFTYHPQGLEPGDVTIHARVRSATGLPNGSPAGTWTPFSFTLIAATPAEVVDLQLLNDTGESDTDSITTDPRLTGRVLREGAHARFSVEFDHNGDGSPDGAVMTDLSGDFRYTPLGLRPGLLTVAARAVMWDASTSQNLYGDWSTIDFTLQTDPIQGNGALPELDDDAFTSAAVAYRRALEFALSTADAAISGMEGLPGSLDSLLIGAFTPFAVRAAGLSLIAAAQAPVSRNYSVTLPVQQTFFTDGRYYNVNDTVTINYVLDVLDGEASGPFTFDLTLSADLSYDELADGDDARFDLHLGGDYGLTFHASGDYQAISGLTVFSGSYTAGESGGAEFSAQQTVTFDGGLVGTSSRVITGTSDMGRTEAGSFGDSGVAADYTLSQADVVTFSFADSGSHDEEFADQYTSETSLLVFENSGSGTTNSLLTESGAISSSGVTGSYARSSGGSESFRYERSGAYDYSYHDAKTDESSSYTFNRSHTGETSFEDTETAEFNAAGATGVHTSTATASNTVVYLSSGADAYDYDDGLNTAARSYDYSESSSQQLTFTTSESVDFAPSGESGDYSFSETGVVSSIRSGSGSDSYGSQDQNSSENNTRTFSDSDVASSTFTGSESGVYTPTTLSGEFSGSTLASRTRNLVTSVTSNYTYADDRNQATAANAFTETLSRSYGSQGAESGTFDSSGYTGVRLFTQNGSGSNEFSGSGSNGWTFDDAQDVNTFNYSFTQSGSAGFNSSDTESSAFSPQDSSTLYSSNSNGTRTSSYSGNGASSRRHEDDHVLDTAVETVTESISTANTFSRTETGGVTGADRIGVFSVTETGSETHNTDNSGEYSHRYEDDQTLETKFDSLTEHRLRELNYSDTESLVFSPAGTLTAYDNSGTESNSFTYSASGEAGYHYQDQLTTIDNTDDYSASGSSANSVVVSDTGTRSADGGSTGLSRVAESSDFSEARTDSGTSSYDHENGNVISTNHGSYTHEKSNARHSDSAAADAYTPTAVSTTRAANLVEDQIVAFSDEGDSYYADLLRTISHVYHSASSSQVHDERHDSSAAGPDGSINSVSELRNRNASQTLTDTWTLDGEPSTSTFSFSDNSSTPYSDTWGTGTPPATPLTQPAGDGPSLTELHLLMDTVIALASAAYHDPEMLDQALATSVAALQAVAPEGEPGSGGAGSSQWFGTPAVGAAFLQQMLWGLAAAGAAGNVSLLSPWEATAGLPSGIVTALAEDHLTPLGNSRFSSQGFSVGEPLAVSPLIVGRQRAMFGIDIFPAVDMIPAEGVGSYLQFRGFSQIADAMCGGIATYTGTQPLPSFSPAWSGLNAATLIEPPAFSMLMPIGHGSMQVISSSTGNPTTTVGIAGSMILTTAAMAPGSVHAELAFMNFSARAADLIGLGMPAFTVRPLPRLH